MAKDPASQGDMAVDDTQASAQSGNKPKRVEHFRNLGLGLFIHWAHDAQLGLVISHSLVGADADYRERFFTELPQTFYPAKFDPAQWAREAKVAGVGYVVFTTKHHSGFCMFETATTEFGIMHTPYTRERADSEQYPRMNSIKSRGDLLGRSQRHRQRQTERRAKEELNQNQP